MSSASAPPPQGGKPLAIVAKTVKGWGCPSLHGSGWHGKPPTGDALKKAQAELDERRVELTTSLASSDQFTIQPPAEAPERTSQIKDMPHPDPDAEEMDMESVIHTGKMATRRAYGIALRALGQSNDRVVALDCDVSNSTFAEYFRKDPELAARFFECRIAEQNMFSVAAGLSAAGRIPFCSTFAKFVCRGYDQIEMAINSGANLKIVGSHAGITLASDGPSQMSLPDVAWFRSWSTIKDHRGEPRVLHPAARGRLRGVRPDGGDGRVRERLLHADPAQRHRVHL